MAHFPKYRLLSAATVVLCLTGISGQALDQLDFQVQGDDKTLMDDLKSASGLLEAQAAKRTNALELLADARAEYAKLIGVLYARGHYGPVIHVIIDGREASGIAPLDAPAAIGKIIVTVDPGPAFVFGRAEIAPLAAKTKLPTGFAKGEIAESGVLQTAVQASIEGWRAQGYAKAAVTGQDVVANHDTSTLNAAIQIDHGPRLRFGPLTVNGRDRMRLERITAIAGLPEGARFDPAEEDRVAERLRRTGVFGSVSLTEDDKVTSSDLLGITLDVVEAKRHRYTFGAEIASADGAALSAGWLDRNVRGGGERLEYTGKISGIGAQSGGTDYTLGVTYDRPATLTPDTELNVGAEISQINDVDSTAKLLTLSVGFTEYFNTTFTGTAAMKFSATEGTDLAGSYSYRSLNLPIGITWDRRDNKTESTKMFYLDAEAMPFYGLGSTDNGLRLTFDARGYKGLGDNRVIFAARLQGGAVLGADILQTPREDLFYSGGGGTVRGQAYQSLGVTVNDGGTDITIGGNQFAAGSLEARVKVTEKIGIVGFTDIGLVGNNGDTDWQAGAGIGVRYATGVGPVRLDLAVPVHSGSGLQVYVGLGQAF